MDVKNETKINKELGKLFAEAWEMKPRNHLTPEQMDELNELEFGLLLEKAKKYKHNFSPKDLKRMEEEV